MDVIFIDKAFKIQGKDFKLISFSKISDEYVDVLAMANGWDEWNTSFCANDTSINGVLQTSADMIIETLSNG